MPVFSVGCRPWAPRPGTLFVGANHETAQQKGMGVPPWLVTRIPGGILLQTQLNTGSWICGIRIPKGRA